MKLTFQKKNPLSWGISLIFAVGLGVSLYWLITLYQAGLRTAPPSPPPIVSRAEWEARPLTLDAPVENGAFDPQSNPDGVLIYPDDLPKVLNTIVVHHSAYPYSGPIEVQNLHMDIRGFADVAYHFLIDAEGVIYEGRKINIRGAHVGGYNTGSIGIVLLGNFNDELPSQLQLTSLNSLVDYLRYAYQVSYLAGHRDYPGQSPDGTECPGDNVYPFLSELAKDLKLKFGIDGYVVPERIE